MRLPPLKPDQLDEEQRALHDRSVDYIDKKFADTFETRDAEGALIGPWNVWIRHPEIGRSAQTLSVAIAKLEALTPRVREIVILAVGGHFDAAYELYAHSAMGRQVGLDDRQIAALNAGRRPENLADDEALAFDCASVLARGGALPGFLYAAARSAFGERGLAQLVYLAGMYALVSITLNAYDVPAPEPAAD